MNTQEHVERLRDKLSLLEKERGVKVVFASVVGSRAYGLEGPDSDCDAKFVFVQPLEKYLEMNGPVEYLDVGDDCTGYDLRVFLRLLKKSGFNAMEMVHSPNVFIGKELRATFASFALACADPYRMAVAYLACIKRCENCFKNTDEPLKKLKQVVTATRLYYSAYAVVKMNVLPVPVVYDDLLNLVERDLYVAVDREMAQHKRNGIEVDTTQLSMLLFDVLQAADALKEDAAALAAVIAAEKRPPSKAADMDKEFNAFFMKQLGL